MGYGIAQAGRWGIGRMVNRTRKRLGRRTVGIPADVGMSQQKAARRRRVVEFVYSLATAEKRKLKTHAWRPIARRKLKNRISSKRVHLL